jgi:hypothetical protein
LSWNIKSAGKAFEVSLDSLNQGARFDIIKLCQILAEHSLLAAQQKDPRLYLLSQESWSSFQFFVSPNLR